jgi:hypothetical protein
MAPSFCARHPIKTAPLARLLASPNAPPPPAPPARPPGECAPRQPPLKLFLKGESENYCRDEPGLPRLTPAAEAPSGWLKFSVPIESFGCFDLGAMTHLEFQNTQPIGATGPGTDAQFCLGEVAIVR